jgi:hypothetical protein
MVEGEVVMQHRTGAAAVVKLIPPLCQVKRGRPDATLIGSAFSRGVRYPMKGLPALQRHPKIKLRTSNDTLLNRCAAVHRAK